MGAVGELWGGGVLGSGHVGVCDSGGGGGVQGVPRGAADGGVQAGGVGSWHLPTGAAVPASTCLPQWLQWQSTQNITLRGCTRGVC